MTKRKDEKTEGTEYIPKPDADAREGQSGADLTENIPERAAQPPYMPDNVPQYGQAGTPPYAQGGTPQYAQGGMPPYMQGGMPPYAQGGMPPYAQGGMPPYMRGGAGQAQYGRDSVIDNWQRDAYKLSQAIPEFDFAAALRNERFREVLARGGSVFEAYAVMAKLPKTQRRGGIIQNAQNPRRGTGESTVNPAKLSDKEFKNYINRIKK